ncbi:MAG: hypothetical protein JRE71_04305 [Deltaproteobacteria bacterium]|nr:hypothetical protein [Deltaproteobacteria bacterium]MBW2723586.1 hypothetical protein [Deltaproteobacteria bacterium]
MGKVLRIVIYAAFLACVATTAGAHHVKCSRDINGDGKVNRKDTKIIETAMGAKIGAAPYDERADLNEDGFVNSDDRTAYSHCR